MTTLFLIAVLSSALSVPPHAPSAAGLVAAFGFEENAGATTADASGGGNTGQLVSAVWTTDGKYGKALVFNGTNARVTLIADTPALRLTTGMTLEAWVKPSIVSSTWRDVIHKEIDNYFLMATSNHSAAPSGGGTFGGVNTSLFGVTPLTVNVWTHLATTYDGARLRLYVNGVEVSSVARTGVILTSTRPLQIGGDSYFGQSFAGTIDEVRVYNRALTPAELQSDMTTPVVTAVVDTVAPSKPAGMTAVAFSGTQVNLSWTPATDDVGVASYQVQRCQGSGCSTFAENGIAAGSPHNDPGLALNTSYTYRVRAVDAAGNPGPFSDAASATTLATTAVPGLVAAYAFDEGSGTTAADGSGFANHGVIANGTWTVAGRYGNALAFNGTSSWVTVSDASSLHLTNGMTLAAWVFPLSIPPSNCPLPDCAWKDVIVKETDRYYIEASSNLNRQPEAGGIFVSGKHIVFAPSPLPIAAWTHLAVTYDAATVRFYVNGVLVAASPEPSPLTSSNEPLRIGGDGVYNQFFHGTIDEVRVYNRALTASEIGGDMSAPIGSGGAHPTPAISGLVPDTAVEGGADFNLTVLGSGFFAGTTVQWNGMDRVTTIVDPTEVSAVIPAGDIASGGTAAVTVFNPPPIGGTSAAAPFAICAVLPEVCDGVDDDCDALVDDADPSLTGATAWHRDADGDAHGDPASSQAACAQPSGYVADGSDCDDANGVVWSLPGETGTIVFADQATLTWSPPAAPGGSSLHYDTLRADAPAGFDVAATCVASDGPENAVVDPAVPSDDAGFYYLVRASNACGRGSLGVGSQGSPRFGLVCP